MNISSRKQILIIYVLLILAVLAVFRQVTGFGFVKMDDEIYVTENFIIQGKTTFDKILWAFSTTYAEFWHPVTWLSFMLDYKIYGLNPAGFHLTNLIVHILSTLLLFWLFHRMTGALWKSAFVAAMFAVHPLHVESVAWVAERKDVLSAFFWMLTLCLYVRYTEKPDIKKYILALFCFALALMSKPMVVTLPLIMILLDYWPLKRFDSRQDNPMLWQLKEKAPFFILSAVFVVITLYAQRKPNVEPFPFTSRIANASVSFMTYIEKTFWPRDLAVFYPFPDQIFIWQALAAALLAVLMTIAIIVASKRRSYVFVGWLWYTITILPVLGIIQIANFSMADRFFYLPSIGLFVMLAWGIEPLFSDKHKSKIILFTAGTAFLIIMALISWQQCRVWKNSFSLFGHALQVTKNNALAHDNLGSALADAGRIEESIAQYNSAMSIKSNAGVYSNRGIAYGRSGQYQIAINDFSKAISLNPGYYKAYNNRGFAYARLRLHNIAINDYSKAIQLKPDYAKAYHNRAASYFDMNNNEPGCADAQKACERGLCDLLEKAKNAGVCR